MAQNGNPRVIIRNGFRAELVTARNQYPCKAGDGLIFPGDSYWRVEPIGSGVRGQVHADKVHADCLDAVLEKYKAGS